MHRFYACSILFALLVAPQQTITMQPQYTPQNTQFAFDFHGVVVRPVANRISHALLSRNFISSIEMNRYLPGLMWAMAALVYRGGTGEQYIKLLRDYHQMRIAQIALDIANNQAPISDTIAIIKQLKSLGYEINMASDIGGLVLQDFETKELKKPAQEQILPLFAHKYYVNYLDTYTPIHKPNSIYFATYLQHYNQDKKSYIIFIDDKLKNVEGARKSGMIAILFSSAAQLKEQLIQMGILPQR